MPEELFDDSDVPLLAASLERAVPVAVRDQHVCSKREQLNHALKVPDVRRRVQGGAATLIGLVDVRSGPQQDLSHEGHPIPHGEVECSAVLFVSVSGIEVSTGGDQILHYAQVLRESGLVDGTLVHLSVLQASARAS